MTLLALVSTLAMASQQLPSSGPWTLLTSPVTVEATLRNSEPRTPQYMASFEFVLAVRDGHTTQQVTSFLIAVEDLADALHVLRTGVAWRPPYLFVRSECGGGNVWTCDTEVVFKVSGGQARKIGAFAVGDALREAPLSFQGGYFVDVYDKLEDAQIGLSHASSPSFRIDLAERNGRVQVVPKATWAINRTRYRENEATIDVWLADDTRASEVVFSAIVVNAVLAKYCAKQREVADLVGRVEPRLDDEYRRLLRRALALAVPLELPSSWRQPE